ncbi:hypothetical protein SAMN05421805_10674 [Saccharopolyspora antimicrobica]|uniref:Uncharacterized protein n=1 Tax=Saccharopolyspora antimicrobica TaxID=455193 RepID=A0A1I5B0Z1_9PSEU|nr:hypothetical protein [Saccharopolyspora antimicrobica]RKT86433.1 hypothetical protein ATL45_4802 [Saccharopolyspora antimicrobica]SFN68357.1 hypothetical protein SAMN05421805_10674 [Saccharopolyspora antimicrobica]
MAHPAHCEHEEWPGNPLDAAREAFGWLTAGDHPVAVDGRLFDHLPAREIPVDELRDLLLAQGCPRQVWDQVWSHVISRARIEGGTWTITAVGLALPMLTSLAARLTERYADDPSDIHAEILRGFLDALQTVDLAEGRITVRLRWAAYRAGHRALLDGMDGPTPRPPGFHSSEPKPPAGHPDLVLARAVEAGVLTRTEAELIGATRLEGIELVDWPRPPGLTYKTLAKHRRKAENRLAAWLAESDTSPDDGDPTGAAATTWQTSDEVTDDESWSQRVAKKVGGGPANRPPKSGLQGRG